ncbi:BatA domain-containing protein [uncultured Croceitalea sp.]|uniref:BatA domain-containing protein n=1 Tax=uncultured Croceitalea sp. TaxID=1798908 RepID=UPI003305B0C0
MQFKHPEILWALLLLFIPIIIHLFQLRRFKKTPFTNVAMLQKVVSESRKSNTLKKWLLLLTRLALLACLILAFAQPFFAKETALQPKETVIYLDDSFSMQAQKDGFSLLERATQDLVGALKETATFSLFTNTKSFKTKSLSSIQNELLALEYTDKQLNFNQIVLKANTFFTENQGSIKNLILISDFQKRLGTVSNSVSSGIELHTVQLKPDIATNISIDSIFLNDQIGDQTELHVLVSGIQENENLPISLFNKNTLIAKTAIPYQNKLQSDVLLSLSKKDVIKGRLQISDNGLAYDNQFYFNIDEKPKIKVLCINESEDTFLRKIYTEDEFAFSSFDLNSLNYSLIEAQNLVVLNGLQAIPNSLQTVLGSFQQNGGSIILIPAANTEIKSYNNFLAKVSGIQFQEKLQFEQPISQINFDHPLFENVFEKRVTNFEYPKTKVAFTTNNGIGQIISYANGNPFLTNNGNTYVFTAPLNLEESNFQSSPLIVPTFYNIGAMSLQLNKAYHTLGGQINIDVAGALEKDAIAKLTKKTLEFIPLQQTHTNKLSLTIDENLEEDGTYAIVQDRDTIQNMSFNYARKESTLDYLNLENLSLNSIDDSIVDLFAELDASNTISDYWKWFVIFALLFALVELMIQKFIT